MKRLLAGLVGGIGLGALFRRRRRRSSQAEVSPAEELRSRLAAAEERTERVEEERVVEPTPAPDELDARRREVHEKARQSLDELA